MSKPRLLFISPQFLFPMDAGGKIRTANILKNLKGGTFEITLIAPATPDEQSRWADDIAALCDQFTAWAPPAAGLRQKLHRFSGLVTALPVSVWSGVNRAAKQAVAAAIGKKPDLIVFDYAHSLALAPDNLPALSLLLAHNVETEIFRRHAAQTRPPMKWLWAMEARKMARFEQKAVDRVDGVIAVSERDAAAFRDDFGAAFSRAIPTGVDTEFFSYQAPAANAPPIVTFTGSMDWRANQDGLEWFMEDIWPRIAAESPEAEFVAIGKNPPPSLVEGARTRGFNWRFTGLVDDVRDHARGAANVIPLRVGGGTRIKAFEAMAMGVPVVSTALGVEGLPLDPDQHYLLADEPQEFADNVLRLLRDAGLRARLSAAARTLVEENHGQTAAAEAFETHCLEVCSAVKMPDNTQTTQ